jgi:hypothetical protein
MKRQRGIIGAAEGKPDRGAPACCVELRTFLVACPSAELSADLPTCGKKDVDALERRGHDSAASIQ